MMKLRWLVLLMALVFLAACGGPPPAKTATLTLAATPNPVPAGGAPVKLDATITAGKENIASVDFAVKDAATALGTDSDTADDVFSFTTAAITANTTFVATAKDSSGAAIGSAEVAVTVTTSSTVTFTLTAAPNPVPVGGAPVKLTANFTAGADKVKSVVFAVKGGATLNTDTTGPDFSFTTTTPVTAATTFTATAKDAAGATLGTTQEVAVTVTSGTTIPAGASKAATVAEVNAVIATTGDLAIIAVTADLTCTVDNCIQLKQGQKLVGANAAGTVVAVRKITVSGTVAQPITAIVLANNTTVDSFDIAGANIFRAVSAPRGLTGTITLNDVDVDMTGSGGAGSRSPIGLGGVEGATDDADPTPATFSVSGVDVTGMTIASPGIEVYGVASVTITNSSVARTATTIEPNVSIIGHTTAVSLDNVRVTSNAGPGIYIYKRTPNAAATVKTMNVTIKNTNTQLTPPTGAVGIKLTGADRLDPAPLPDNEKMVVQAGSIGNISNAATKADVNADVVQGAPTF
jgi:hypothetical protein